jgi:hypothetical protein
MNSAEQMIKSLPDSQVVLMADCAARLLSLGGNMLNEVETVKASAGSRLPYQFAYGAGEFCPTSNKEGKLVNNFHNFSLAVCCL